MTRGFMRRNRTLVSMFLSVISFMWSASYVHAVPGPPDSPPVIEFEITPSPSSIDMGSVEEGNSSGAITLSVTNTGNTTYGIGTISIDGTDSSEFGISNDLCSGQNLGISSSCTVDIIFSPTSTGTKSAEIVIPTTSEGASTVTVPLSGTGSAVPVPDISVPFSLDFGNVTVGEGITNTVTISNNGTDNLLVTDIFITGTDAVEFSLDAGDGTGGTCGSAPTVAQGGSCNVIIGFNPASEGSKTAVLEIDSDDPDTATASVSLNGNGVAVVTNLPPAASVLVSPENSATGVVTPVTFKWNPSTDPESGAVTYDLYVCEGDNTFSGACSTPVNASPITIAVNKAAPYAGAGIGLLFFGLAMCGGISRRRIFVLLITILIMSGVLVSCGGGGGGGGGGTGDSGGGPVDGDGDSGGSNVTYTESTLTSSTIYYWKVVSEDDFGNRTDSETWSFTTE
jgi:uncharacterized repeat protein (TIGR01451 family)